MDNVALLQRIWGPIERGESTDIQPFFDHLDDDVVLTTSVGELRGKRAVLHYFTHAEELVEFRPFERPQQYFADGNQVVTVGEETLVRASGVTARVPWAWVYTLDNGLITRIEAIEDLSAVADAVARGPATAVTHHAARPPRRGRHQTPGSTNPAGTRSVIARRPSIGVTMQRVGIDSLFKRSALPGGSCFRRRPRECWRWTS